MSIETFRYTSEGEQYIRTGNEIAEKAEKIKRPRIKNLVGRTNPDGTGKSFEVNRPTEAKTSENVKIRKPDFSLSGRMKKCEKEGFNEIGAGSFLLYGSERDIDARISKMPNEEKKACIEYLMGELIKEQDRQAAVNRAVRKEMSDARTVS